VQQSDSDSMAWDEDGLFDTTDEEEDESEEGAVWAATSATAEEEMQAKDRRQQGLKPIVMEKRPYRPPVLSEYVEPDHILDPLEGMEVLYEGYGNVLHKQKLNLPERQDVIRWDEKEHGTQLKENLQWRETPLEFQDEITRIIKERWDVFDRRGISKSIRGFEFNIDTGAMKPICCQLPRYGTHESAVILKLADQLEKNGFIEDDEGPWGALVVLAGKPNQEHLPWWDYVFRLCVSYRKLNAVTRPFKYPTPRCDDAILGIRGQWFITMDLDSGYWQVKLADGTKDKTAFFIPGAKKRWKVMPMGCTNALPFFVAMVDWMRKEWNRKATELGIRGEDRPQRRQDPDSKTIVDDILLSAATPEELIRYFRVVLEVLEFYRVSVKLRKCRFMMQEVEFVGVDILSEGNRPAKSKDEAFEKLEPPKSYSDLRALIGFFGFYQEWIPLYEFRLGPWRTKIKEAPPPGVTPKKEEAETMRRNWTKNDQDLFNELKKEIREGPILARPDDSKRFYLKTDWCKDGGAAALCQRGDNEEAINAEQREIDGGPCEFDLAMTGKLRLRPNKFISRRVTKQSERGYHSYVGEAGVGVWAIEKNRYFLFGWRFTWITDCSGLKKFFEGKDLPSHMMQRWRMQLLRYDFTIVHRSARFMKETDVLSRYNNWCQEWRKETDQDAQQKQDDPTTPQKPTTNTFMIRLMEEDPQEQGFLTGLLKDADQEIPFSNHRVQVRGEMTSPKTKLAEAVDETRTVWLINPMEDMEEEALMTAGIETEVAARISTERDPISRCKPARQQIQESKNSIEREEIDWIVGSLRGNIEEKERSDMTELVKVAIEYHKLRGVVLFTENGKAETLIRELKETAKEQRWYMREKRVENVSLGGAIRNIKQTIVMHVDEQVAEEFRGKPEKDPFPKSIQEFLDEDPQILEDYHWPTEATKIENKDDPYSPKAYARVKLKGHEQREMEVFDTLYPAPTLDKQRYLTAPFGIVTLDKIYGTCTRGIRPQELLRMHGLNPGRQIWEQTPPEKIWENLEWRAPREIVKWASQTMFLGEKAAQPARELGTLGTEYNEARIMILRATVTAPGKDKVMIAPATFNEWTTLPLPTDLQWQHATQQDSDLALLTQALKDSTVLDRTKVNKKEIHTEWREDRFELEEGILYKYEVQKRIRTRQIRAKVVPKNLRHVILAACHTSPMAGHAGIQKTYFRVVTRFWWPTMAKDITEFVSSCGHCRLANATNHESAGILKALDAEVPFDVVFLDVWSPGDIQEKNGEIKILTCLDGMTSFAGATPVKEMTSTAIARAAFMAFFVPNGLPRLIIFDAGSEFAGPMREMCQQLAIPFHQVSKENHKAILCERFHRYLNKVQTINSADSQSLDQWMMGVMFSLYAWNAAPMDGTNIVKSFAAKAKEFHFPIDLKQPATGYQGTNSSQEALWHVEAVFPLLRLQQEVLTILNKDRREKHRALKNETRKEKNFQVGDIVIVKKQKKSVAGELSAKLVFKAKGPYRILEKEAEGNGYKIQLIPFNKGDRRPGRIQKESATRMEKLPSTVIISKKADGVDTRLAQMESKHVMNPLENALGAYEFAEYKQAPEGSRHGFVKIEDLWQEQVDGSDDEDNDSEEGGDETDEKDQQEDLPEEENTGGRENKDDGDTRDTDSEQHTQQGESDKRDGKQQERDSKLEKPKEETPQKTSPAQQQPGLRRSNRTVNTPIRFRLPPPQAFTPRGEEYARLFETVKGSKDKLFIIRRAGNENWRIVSVDTRRSDVETAKTRGIYYVNFWTAHPEDAKKVKRRNCRYWPEIWRLGTNNKVKRQPVNPKNATQFLNDTQETHKWVGTELNLQDEKVTGPFEFTQKYRKENTIHNEIWSQLIIRAQETNTDTAPLDEIRPVE
jgi:hypothetical protein